MRHLFTALLVLSFVAPMTYSSVALANQEDRQERREDRQENRKERRKMRQDNRKERREARQENRQERRKKRAGN
tara:strand:+ start:11853 stop:12074 length:222 start_codon:yes stop_codon:yes gene_type:complete